MRAEDAWADARFAASSWNRDDAECAECGGAIDELSDTCMECGEPYLSPAVLREREEAAAADYYAGIEEDRRLGNA